MYEAQGTGKLFVPLSNFSANQPFGRNGVLTWDACNQGVNGTRFDNGTPLWPTPAGTCSTLVCGSFCCDCSPVALSARFSVPRCLTRIDHSTLAVLQGTTGSGFRSDW